MMERDADAYRDLQEQAVPASEHLACGHTERFTGAGGRANVGLVLLEVRKPSAATDEGAGWSKDRAACSGRATAVLLVRHVGAVARGARGHGMSLCPSDNGTHLCSREWPHPGICVFTRPKESPMKLEAAERAEELAQKAWEAMCASDGSYVPWSELAEFRRQEKITFARLVLELVAAEREAFQAHIDAMEKAAKSRHDALIAILGLVEDELARANT